MHRRSVAIGSLALAWALLAATPAAADSPVPLLDFGQQEPSDGTTGDGAEDGASEDASEDSPADAAADAPADAPADMQDDTQDDTQVDAQDDTQVDAQDDTQDGTQEVRPGRGAPVLTARDRGRKVKVLQVRLQRVGVRDMPISGLFGQETVAQVKRFQRKAGFARSGVVDQATLEELTRRTGVVDRLDLAAGENRPYGRRLPASCLKGRVVCVDKRALAVRWVVDGVVKQRLDARFGSDATPTREGVFSITRKSRDHVSSLYDSSMPFALFFDGGQAVHYSPDFASRGYSGASHGCVNTRNYSGMKALFGRADVGDRVVVYRSRSTSQLKRA